MAGVRQRARDYAGIAALITAVTTAVSVVLTQASYREESDLVQDSAFAVLQYRVDQLEKRCMPALLAPPPHRHLEAVEAVEEAAGGDEEASEAAEEVFVGETALTVEVAAEESPEPPEAVRKRLQRKLRRSESVGLTEIRQYVQQSGRAFDMER